MKESYPGLFERIRQQVKAGKLEPQGALWVECDANLTGGESIVRQILYGRQFFHTEFGVDPEYIWLPDTFGYSAALPQLIHKAGMRYFSTQKLSWSLINHFPYHSFWWQGIDGTAILVHTLPEENYNSPAQPRSVGKIESNYAEKGVSDHALMVFGIGDGGGGPGEEHLERLKRIKNFAGLSPVKQEWTADFLRSWEKDSNRFPTWAGELYLERHQGTLTSHSRNKWYNRRMEQALREWEAWATLLQTRHLAEYPQARLEAIWKETLLYQFHDILPGSSIKRVYDESIARYIVLLKEVEENIAQALRTLAAQVDTHASAQPAVFFNSLSWARTAWVQVKAGWQQVTVPPLGYQGIDAARSTACPAPSATVTGLENDRLKVTFDACGALLSLFDKIAEREALPQGELANRLMVYTDHGDAWDFPMDYAAAPARAMQLINATARVDGPRAMVEQTYALGNSELKLEISLEMGSPRLEFSARLHWREPRTMLRALFPVNIFAEQATFEIQYGHVLRSTHTNTTWDLAKDEVPAQKWVDLSQRDYGVALLNDSKYGHRVKGHTIELNLLRSVPYPGTQVAAPEDVLADGSHPAFSDQNDLTFRYAILPHAGDLVTGKVIQQAYEFNIPLRKVDVLPASGNLPASFSWVEVDAPEIIVEAVKQAEDGQGMILRLYESQRSSVNTTLRVRLPFTQAEEVDLLENPLHSLEMQGEKITLAFHPFEIKTLRLW